ncbi:unnamed protein product [Arctogadus glacialis]
MGQRLFRLDMKDVWVTYSQRGGQTKGRRAEARRCLGQPNRRCPCMSHFITGQRWQHTRHLTLSDHFHQCLWAFSHWASLSKHKK